MANNNEVADHVELPTSSELPANCESPSETSESIYELQYFSAKTQTAKQLAKPKQQPVAKQTTSQTKPAVVEFKKKARNDKNKLAKRTEIQPTIWVRMDELESEDERIQNEVATTSQVRPDIRSPTTTSAKQSEEHTVRCKYETTEFYGHNVVVTRIESTLEKLGSDADADKIHDDGKKAETGKKSRKAKHEH